MARNRKKPPGLGRPLQRVMLGGCDTPRVTRKIPRKQAFRRQSNFARDAVYSEFGYRHGRALDYGAFVDRKPGPASRPWRSAQ